MKRALTLAVAIALAACEPEAPPAPPPQPVAALPQPPAPPEDPAPIVDGQVTQLSLDGLTVLVKRTPGAELVTAKIYLRGGVRNWTASNAGVEQLALWTATSGGTEALAKEAFTRRLAALGSYVWAWSGFDFSNMAAKSLLPNFDETFGMLCDTLLAPALPQTEIELHRAEMLSSLRHEQETPDGQLRYLSHFQLYKGHPYENRPMGTVESVSKLGAQDLKQYLAGMRDKSRLAIIVVGDVDAEHVAELVRARLGSLPRGSYAETPLPKLAFDKPRVDVVPASLPTTYVNGIFPGPLFDEPDYYAGIVGMQHLGFGVFEEVRTKRNLSYAPNAGNDWTSGVPLGWLYVTAVDPETTIKVMFAEVDKLASTPLTDKELAAARETLLTENLQGSEATDAQAGWLARGLFYTGDFRFQSHLRAHLAAVTAADVQAFAKRRIAHLQFEILGKNVDPNTFMR